MTDIADFEDLMPLTVTVAPFVSRDSYGAATYGTAKSYKARVTYKTHYVRTAEAEQALARGIMWLATSDSVTVNDRFTLPDATHPIALDVQRVTDEAGAVLYVRVDMA